MPEVANWDSWYWQVSHTVAACALYLTTCRTPAFAPSEHRRSFALAVGFTPKLMSFSQKIRSQKFPKVILSPCFFQCKVEKKKQIGGNRPQFLTVSTAYITRCVNLTPLSGARRCVWNAFLPPGMVYAQNQNSPRCVSVARHNSTLALRAGESKLFPSFGCQGTADTLMCSASCMMHIRPAEWVSTESCGSPRHLPLPANYSGF